MTVPMSSTTVINTSEKLKLDILKGFVRALTNVRTVRLLRPDDANAIHKTFTWTCAWPAHECPVLVGPGGVMDRRVSTFQD